jgi:hypothetical protein
MFVVKEKRLTKSGVHLKGASLEQAPAIPANIILGKDKHSYLLGTLIN